MPQEYFGPHYAGISEDDSAQAFGQVLYSENMDLSSTSSYVNIGRGSSSYISGLPDDVISMFQDDRVGVLICDDDRNLYRNGNSTAVLTTDRMVGYWIAKGYLYMIDTTEDIHRILLTDTTNADWSTYITTTDTTLPTANVDHFNIIAQEDITYIAYAQNLYVINNSSGTVDPTVTYDFLTDDVVGMTTISNTIKIYQKNGDMFLWYGIANEGFVEKVNLDVGINHVHQVANIDYIVSSGRLYYVNGYTLEPILYNYYSDDLNSDKINFSRSAINGSGQFSVYLNGEFYMAGDDSDLNLGDGINAYGGASVITYGKKQNILSNSLNVFSTFASTGEKYDEIYGIISQQSSTSNQDYIYVAYKDSTGTIGVDRFEVSEGRYAPNDDNEGVIVYKKFNGESAPHIRKKLNKVIISGELQDGDEIDLMYIDTTNDSGDNLVSILTIDDITQSENGEGKIFERDTNLEFNAITFALRFRQDGSRFKNNCLKYISLYIEYEYLGQ